MIQEPSLLSGGAPRPDTKLRSICLGHLPLFNAAFTEANTTGLPSDIMAKHIDKQVRLLHTAVLTCRPMSAK